VYIDLTKKSLTGPLLLLLLLISLPLQGQESTLATISVTGQFSERLLPVLKFDLSCGQGHPENGTFTLAGAGKLELDIADFENPRASCRVTADLPRGYTAVYSASGDSGPLADRKGCRFTRITAGHGNQCRIEVTQDPVTLTVYNKWIGASGDEADIRVSLDCESGEYSGSRYINEGSPKGWEIRNVDPDGILCNVSESVRDNFSPDIIDCQGLYILPGKGEECTMFNTKIVKRIETLNRYGKFLMIFLVLAIGLAAAKRFT
jgi:hypothetical protein